MQARRQIGILELEAVHELHHNFGLIDGWARVMEALYDLRARGQLPEDELAAVERLVAIAEPIVYRM